MNTLQGHQNLCPPLTKNWLNLGPLDGVGLSLCVWRLGLLLKCVLHPRVIIFGVLRLEAFWHLRPRPNFYCVLLLTVFCRLASAVKIQASRVMVSLKKILDMNEKFLHPMHSKSSRFFNFHLMAIGYFLSIVSHTCRRRRPGVIIFGVSRSGPYNFGVLRPTGPLNPTPCPKKYIRFLFRTKA